MKKKKEKRDERKSKWLFLLVFFILSAAIAVFSILCVAGMNSRFTQKYFLPLSILVGGLTVGLFLLAVWASLTFREILQKSLLSAYILLLFCLVVWFILQRTGFFEVIRSAESLRIYLERTGAWMPALYILLQFLQVVVLPIPSVVSTVAGVALFGALRATVYSLVGILLGSFVAFWIGRRLGNSAATWLVGADTLQRWQKKLKGKDNLFLTLAFLLPLFPDDILCLLAGLSTMSTKYFVTVIVISRIFAVSATCYSVDFIPFNTWWGLTIWGVLAGSVVLAFVLVYRNLDKLQRIFKGMRKK